MNHGVNKRFLTAEWRQLVMLNYDVDPRVLAPHVPAGTELDTWQGRHLVSVVGFLFLNTRVRGVPIPFYRDFEEVNLRMYVRRQAAEGWRRGVVFIKEIVPRAAIAWTARVIYHEPYIALPMRHRIEEDANGVRSAGYFWQFGGRENSLKLTVAGPAQPLAAGSEAEFITEHYWGYNRQRAGSTMEYHVEHPRWRVYEALETTLDCDVVGLYGDAFRESLSRPPVSAFLAEGSAVTVYVGTLLAG